MKLKKKLISATLSLVVATVLMASSSYAWFTISTNPEVSNIRTSITANENIEIALDNGYANAEAVDAAGAVINGLGHSGNPYTWGNLLDLSVAMTNIGGMLSLKPVGYSYDSVTNKVTMKTPEYGLDGRVARLNNMAQQYISAYNAITSPSGGVSVFKPSEDATTADALALSFWLRSNENVSLKLSEGTYRADDGTNADGTVNAEQGLGSSLVLKLDSSVMAEAETYLDICEAKASEIPSFFVGLGSAYWASFYGENPSYNESAYIEEWKELYEGWMALIPESITRNGITIDCIFSIENPSEEEKSYINLAELNRMMQSSLQDTLHITSYIRGVSVCIVPTQELQNYLNKIKIRFNVQTGDGTQVLYANRVPRWESEGEGIFKILSSAEGYPYKCEGKSFSPAVVIESLKEIPARCDIENGTMTFPLRFYTAEQMKSADYRKNYLIYKGAEEGLQQIAQVVAFQENLSFLNMLNAQNHTHEEVIEESLQYTLNRAKELMSAYEETLPHLELSANKAKKVDVYMYLDGEAVTNADALTMDGIELSLNLQFEKIGGAHNAMTAAKAGESVDDSPLEGGSAYGLYLADKSLHLVYGMETYTVGQQFAGSTIAAIDPLDLGRTYESSPFGSASNATSIVVESSFRRARPTSMSHWFSWLASVSSITGLENINTSCVESMKDTFMLTGRESGAFIVSGLSSWNTANVTNMNGMFYEAGKNAGVFDIGSLASWNTSNVSDMSYMFYCAGNSFAVYQLDLSSWTTKPGCEHGYFNDGVESKVIPPQWR